jgi:MFS family permease
MRWLNRSVLGAGLTSALGDFGYETASVILPGLLAALGIPAAALGAIEGLADAASSLTKPVAGYIADRLGHRKALVCLGYGLTPFGQALIALASGWPLILAGRTVGWFGRGLRGPLRDAIVAESITPQTRGRAFGFHRAADSLGAVLGPALGVVLLAALQRLMPAVAARPFRSVLWLTLIPGSLSVVSFAILVRDDRSIGNPAAPFWRSIRDLPAKFRGYLAAVGLFGAGDYAHTLLILAATVLLRGRLGVARAAQVAGLLYVLRNVVQTAASYPLGALADRAGARRVLVLGYALGVATSVMTALAFVVGSAALRFGLLVVVFVFAGAYVAAEDAIEAALTADFVPQRLHNIGYGVLGATNGIGDLISSTLVGILWTAVSAPAAFLTAAAIMLCGTVLMARAPTSAPEC